MAKRKTITINAIVAVDDAILGTTYTTEPMTLVDDKFAHAQNQFTKYQNQKTQKVRCQRTKKK